MNFTRTVTRLGAASIIGIAMMASPQLAAGESPPSLDKPTIAGTPVVGATLTASAQVTGDPAPVLSYAWFQCAARNSSCDAIAGATGSSYVVAPADKDHRLSVRVRAESSAGTATERSALTAVVAAAPPPPPPPPPPPTPVPTATPVPTPTPTPTPVPSATPSPPAGETDTSPRFDQSSPAAPAIDVTATIDQEDARMPYLRPFPVVRITGTVVPGGARVSRLRIKAPATARVVVRCRGGGCRLVSRTLGGGRVRALERLLRSGTRITIRISRPGRIGKHVAIVIRDGRPPKRRDACLMPGSTRPVECPAP